MNNKPITEARSNNQPPIRVLMADPDESLGMAYREPLSQEGFELDTAVSGLDCVARLREQVPDVLVLEPRMPWGGGAGVLAMMGENPRLATVPVMVLTSCRDPRVMEGVERFPISDYQVKPITPNRLLGRLRVLLRHPRLNFEMTDQNGRLKCAITQRTNGRVRDLRVETRDGHIVVHGRSDSHHVKQLVLAAVTEVLQASEFQTDCVELNIEVVPNEPWQLYQSTQSGTKNWNYTRELDLTKEN